VIRTDGSRSRLRRSEVLGTLKEYPTRRLAERALEMECKRCARTAGIAERTPNALASYEAVHTTERLG
jgi:hypothetical protein